jgi:hypothetical protein
MIKRATIQQFLLCITLLLQLSFVFAQRNLLEAKATKEQVAQVLLPTTKWVSYPAYSDRTAWDKLTGDRKAAIIQEGEKFLTYEWKVVKATDYLAYERNGTRVIMENPFNSNNTALMHLFLAELAEGKGKFIDQLINGVWHTCDMRSWVLSAHQPVQRTKRALPDEAEVIIDLTSGDIGSLLSWIHYFLAPSFDNIDPVIAARIRKEVKVRILDPYLQRSDYWWQALSGNPDQMVNNWNPWCNFNVLAAFLLMETDANRKVEAVHKSMRSVDRFIDYTKDDGACEEGPSYWGHAAGKMYDYLQLLSYATGGKVDIFAQPKIRAMGEYIARSYIGNGWVVNFADASAKGGGEAGLVYRYGKATNSTEMQRFAAYLHQKNKEEVVHARDAFRTLESLWSEKEVTLQSPALSTAASTWYPQTQFCYMRSKDAFFGAKGGYNAESHNHNDVGSFIYYLKNTPLLIDAGVGTYTKFTFGPQRYSIWTMQSEYHNLPVINGTPQKDGRDFRAKNVSFDASKRRLQLDISGAYPKLASVTEWLLDYELSETGILTIKEKYSLKGPQYPNQLNFLSAVPPMQVEPGKIRLTNNDASAIFSYDAAAFDYSVLPVELPDVRLSRVWGKTIYRIQLRAKSIQSDGSYSFVITPEK